MADDGTPESQEAPRRGPLPGDSVDTGQDSQSHVDPTGPDALAEALERLAEAREYVVYLLAAEFDRLKLRLRRAAMWAIVGLAAVVILLAILVTAVGMLLWGLATLIVSLLGWPMWAGALAVGGGVLLLAVTALLLDFWAWNREAFARARRRYETRKEVQRGRFGRSVDPEDDQQESLEGEKPAD